MCEGPHPFIPVANTAQVDMHYTHLGEKVMNTYHVIHPEGWNVPDLAAVMTIFEDWNADQTLSLRSNQTVLTDIRAFDLSVEAGSVVEKEVTVDNVGSATNFPEPGVVTVAVKKASNVRGRGTQGRNFWIGLPEAAVDGNQITSALRGGILTAMNALRDALVAADRQLVVVSYCQNNTWREFGVTTIVTGFSLDIYIDSQTRRGAGRGR